MKKPTLFVGAAVLFALSLVFRTEGLYAASMVLLWIGLASR